MGELELLSVIVSALEQAEVPYMVTGSVASLLYGEPRATNDIDIVIDPSDAQLERLLTLISDSFLVSQRAVDDAFRRRSMFNAIDMNTGEKIDLIVRKSRDYSTTEFDRRRRDVVCGVPLSVVAPEDSILSKLEWAKAGESERQLRDAAGVLAAQGKALDWPYLEEWAGRLGLTELLARAAADARKMGECQD